MLWLYYCFFIPLYRYFNHQFITMIAFLGSLLTHLLGFSPTWQWLAPVLIFKAMHNWHIPLQAKAHTTPHLCASHTQPSLVYPGEGPIPYHKRRIAFLGSFPLAMVAVFEAKQVGAGPPVFRLGKVCSCWWGESKREVGVGLCACCDLAAALEEVTPQAWKWRDELKLAQGLPRFKSNFWKPSLDRQK